MTTTETLTRKPLSNNSNNKGNAADFLWWAFSPDQIQESCQCLTKMTTTQKSQIISVPTGLESGQFVPFSISMNNAKITHKLSTTFNSSSLNCCWTKSAAAERAELWSGQNDQWHVRIARMTKVKMRVCVCVCVVSWLAGVAGPRPATR